MKTEKRRAHDLEYSIFFFLVAFNNHRSAAQSADLEKNIETGHAFLKVANGENKWKFER